MFDEKTVATDRKMRELWKSLLEKKYKSEGTYRTLSGIPIKPTYSPSDIDHLDIADIGMPGVYPYTRSIYPLHYQFQPWMMQQVLGYGLAEHTRERMDLMVREGMEGYFGYPVFNIVFDNPTKGGIDPDNPEARGHVGLGGMSFSHIGDMEILFRGLPLDKVNVSLITGDTCLYALACYIVTAEKMGFSRRQLHGNSMNWLIKGFCVDNPDVKPEGAMKLMVELIRFCTAHMPYWNTTNISGYLIREAGANAVQELAFTMQWGIAIIQACIDAGLDVDAFAPRLGFQMSVHDDFFEDIAKLRAHRRIWAKLLRERFGSRSERSQVARIHVHTAGDSLTAQQPLSNIVRIAIQALAAVLGGTNSLHTCGYDETITIPTAEAARLSLRTQQIIMYETRVTQVTDPLAGSYFLEDLTDKIEREVWSLIKKIDDMGGFLKVLENGWLRAQLNEEAFRYHERIRQGQEIKVGLNKYCTEETVSPEVVRIDPRIEQEAIRRIKELKASRDSSAVRTALDSVRRAAEKGEGITEAVIEAVKARATQGEVWDILKEIYGWGFVA